MTTTLHRRHNPKTAPAAFSAYSPAVEVDEHRRWLHVSGQVGADAEGRLASDPKGQIAQALENVLAVLAAAGMGREHLVKLNVFLTHREDIGLYREVRDRLLHGAEPASTLLVVAGLADPAWRVEIEAVAAA